MVRGSQYLAIILGLILTATIAPAQSILSGTNAPSVLALPTVQPLIFTPAFTASSAIRLQQINLTNAPLPAHITTGSTTLSATRLPVSVVIISNKPAQSKSIESLQPHVDFENPGQDSNSELDLDRSRLP